ncbi:MAG: hypothetical protein Q8N60_05705 [Candidatus Diapherotrites archaeon]|nr:hypothetical protein [Candidatus Diapherotrites archaeon]
MPLQNPPSSISTKAEPTAGLPEKTKSTEQAAFSSAEEKPGENCLRQAAGQAPERAKGSIEIIKETLQELKQPSAWLRYTKEIIAGPASQGAGKGEKKQPEQGAGHGKKISKGEKRKFWQALQKPSFWINVALLIILAIVLAWIYL